MLRSVTRVLLGSRTRPYLPFALVLLSALVVRLIWLALTEHTAEDAFITFRFAGQLSQGLGFTYNVGERVYGTTTPLFTLLLAAWQLVTRGDIALGAHILGLAASMGSLVLLDAVLLREGLPAGARLLVLAVLALSSKVLILDLQGMEMPLVILLMMASWLAITAGRPGLAGLLAGCLLWTRVDLALWPVALAFAERRPSFKRAATLVGIAALTYLPWVVFASLYFGSPIPHTITAKQVAHGLSKSPLSGHVTTVLAYLSLLDLRFASRLPHFLAGGATLALAGWQAVRMRRSKAFVALSVFVALEYAGLVLTRATFQARYLYPLLWSVLILATLGATSLLRAAAPRGRWLAGFAGMIAVAALLLQAGLAAGQARATQRYRYKASLQAIGLWLAARGPGDATVLLEPLGYIGYFSGMHMIDEVGLVSQKVVTLKLSGIPVEEYFAVFWPNYVVEHCDDAARFEQTQTSSGIRFVDHYTRVATFDPLGATTMSGVRAAYPGLARSSCYVVWDQNDPGPP
jgi:hypothetical protein